MAEKNLGQLRMRELNKPEYFLMKDIMSHFKLDDTRECFSICLKLLHDLAHFDPQGKTGQRLILATINSWRREKGEVREYTKMGEIFD